MEIFQYKPYFSYCGLENGIDSGRCRTALWRLGKRNIFVPDTPKDLFS